MYLSKVSLKQFRSYQDAEFLFDKSLTLITGNNGIGKTNLLEALHVLLQGSSFRVSDKDMIKNGETWWRIDGLLDDETRQVRYQLGHSPAKQLIVHDAQKRFMYKDRLPVVLFEPNDLQLIHGSPTRRRDSLDMMLIALSSSYKTALGKYERALRQRNNALKKQVTNLEDRLFSWDILLSEYGVEIIRERQDLIDKLNKYISGYYSEIAGDIYDLEIKYHSDLGRDVTASKYISQLHSKLQLDTLRGVTSVGPHRDDIDFRLRGVDVKQNASRGEIRTILLAMKMTYAHLLEEVYDIKPLILFDDVFSELDNGRQNNLLSTLRDNQVIITDTKVVTGAGRHIQL